MIYRILCSTIKKKEERMKLKPRNNYWIFVICIVFSIAILITGITSYYKLLPKNTPSMSNKYKSYTNEIYKFSFNYIDKSEFFVETCGLRESFVQKFPKESSPSKYPLKLILDVYPTCGSGFSTSMQVIDNTRHEIALDYFMRTHDVKCNASKSDCESKNVSERTKYQVYPVTNDRYEGIRVHPTTVFGGDPGLDHVYIQFNKYILDVALDMTKDGDQILSTLVFQ